MSTSTDIIFLDSRTLGYPGSLEQVVRVFTDRDFELDEVRVVEHVGKGKQFQQGLRKIISDAYDSQTITFVARNPAQSLEFFQQLAWGSQQMGGSNRVYVRTSTLDTRFWRSGYDNARFCTLLLDVAKGLYDILWPTFGWIDLYYGWTTTHEDVEAANLRMLYWANFFGPKLVEKLGRDRTLSAPAWRIDELTDGGLLYLLAPHLGLTDEHVLIEDVKEYWGIENVR